MNDRNTISENGADARPLTAGRSPAGGSRLRLFRLGAVLVGLLPLLLLEIGLRGLDLGRPTDQPGPSAGFNQTLPLFERSGPVFRTTRTHAPFVASQEFPVEKPRGGFRVFCFGGSTVYGHPYLGATAFPKWLELELAGSDPTRSWQVINCGGVSYASYRIAPMVREALQHQPDLIILATGHNEFLEDRTYHALKSRSAVRAWLEDTAYSLRLVTLARHWLARTPTAARPPDVASDHDPALNPNVTTRLDSASGYASYRRDAAWHKNVIAQYDDTVRAIVADCQAAHVPILLVRLGTNLRDCPPFKSEHRAGLAPEPEADWQTAFDLATGAEKFDLTRALQFYLEAAAIDREHALLNYRIARTLDRLDRKTEALAYFEKAKDEDICPLRIISPVAQSLTRIAVEMKVPLVDAAGLLAAKSPDGIPGYDWYVDHVHPTIGGHQWIARALAAQMRESGLLAWSAVWPEDKRLGTYSRHLEELGPTYFADGARRVGWLEKWARRQRLAEETIPNDAPGYARLGFRRLDLGDDAGAQEAFDEALERDPAVVQLIRDGAKQRLSEGRPESTVTLGAK